MPLPVVVVQIAPSDPEPQLVEMLLDACSEGIRQATCVRADSATDGATWGVAIVSWRDDDETRVQIEFGKRQDGASEWQSREVVFEATDRREERWRTVGYTVGTLAGREASTPARPLADPVVANPAPPRTKEEPATVTPVTRQEWLRLGGAFTGGPGLTDGPWRGGGQARVTAIPLAPLFATASARHLQSARQSGVACRWTGLSVGLGGQVELEPLRIDLDAELLAENLRADLAEGTLHDAGQHWSLGALGRAAVSWPNRGRVGLITSVETWTRRDSTVVSLRNAPVGRWPASGWSLSIGAELRVH